MVAIVDPQASRRREVGEGRAPVVAVLLTSAKKRQKADEPIADPNGRESPP
jgi:hypothetical protein